MQQAIRPGTGSVWFGPAANRVNQAVVASVALVGAGLIAVSPSAPTLPGLQERAVKLTSVDPNTVFPVAEENLQHLITAIEANPDPVGEQLAALNAGYESTFTTALQGVQTGVTNAIDGYTSATGHVHEGLAATLQTIDGYLSQGDLYDAYATYDYYSLEALEGITKPLNSVLAIPGEMSQTFTNVLENFLTFSTGENLLEAFEAPSITETVEFTQVFDGIEAALQAGNTSAALTDIENAPLELLGAYLNGDTFTFAAATAGGTPKTEDFPGLLSFAGDGGEAGTLQQLLINIPDQLATALGASSTDTASAVSNLLDPGLLTDFTSPLDLIGSVLGGL